MSEVKVKTFGDLTQEYFQLVAKLGEKAYHLTKVSQTKDNEMKVLSDEMNGIQGQIDALQAEGAKLRELEAAKINNDAKNISDAQVVPPNNVVPINSASPSQSTDSISTATA